MPVLKLKFKNNLIKDYPLTAGQTITIGRAEANDIIIDNMSVSGLHARIDSVSATYILTDLESTNGTFVNEKLIATHTLRDGDTVLIGKHELIFDRSDLDASAADEDSDDDKTQYLDTNQYRELIEKSMGKQPSDTTEEKEPAQKNDPGIFSKIFKKIF